MTRGISSVGLEHLPCTQRVKGSTPLFSTWYIKKTNDMKVFLLGVPHTSSLTLLGYERGVVVYNLIIYDDAKNNDLSNKN